MSPRIRLLGVGDGSRWLWRVVPGSFPVSRCFRSAPTRRRHVSQGEKAQGARDERLFLLTTVRALDREIVPLVDAVRGRVLDNCSQETLVREDGLLQVLVYTLSLLLQRMGVVNVAHLDVQRSASIDREGRAD